VLFKSNSQPGFRAEDSDLNHGPHKQLGGTKHSSQNLLYGDARGCCSFSRTGGLDGIGEGRVYQ
jgi:hypothetical protein